MPLDLSRLDPEQLSAVTAPPGGPIIVWAGAGTGKTRTLTARFAWLVAEGADPARIMAVTFTRKAADEMRGRIARLLTLGSSGSLRIGTFHAQMARDLRTRAAMELASVGRSSAFTIYDEGDRERLLKRIIRAAGSSVSMTPGDAADDISRRKNEGAQPSDPDVPVALRPIWRQYERELAAADAMDFDDLLAVPVRLLHDFLDLRAGWVGSIDHLLVDEVQDTNPIQLELAEILSNDGANLFVVGDDAQQIYSFRGVSPETLIDFRRRHPDTREINLVRNYRSTAAILEVANTVLRNNPENIAKDLRPAGEPGPRERPSLYIVADELVEARLIASSLARAAGVGFPLRECAVLVRKNSQTRAIESALATAGLPYHLLGATAFWSRREVRDLVAWLRAIRSSRDELGYLRALGAPARGIGDKLTEAIRERVVAGDDWPTAIKSVADSQAGQARGRAELLSFAELRSAWAARLPRIKPVELIAEVLEASALREAQGEGEEADDRRANLDEVAAAAAPFGRGDLDAFLETAVLDGVAANAPRNGVALATLHAAKGLEWSVVFLAGCEEGLLPHQHAYRREEIAEERRLFYVGVTRARRQLVLTAARRRRMGGRYGDSRMSRFLSEVRSTINLRNQAGPDR